MRVPSDAELDALFGLLGEIGMDTKTAPAIQANPAFEIKLTLPTGETKTLTVIGDGGKTDAELAESLRARFHEYTLSSMRQLNKVAA